MVGSVITERLASLAELQTIYSYEDALILYDILLTNRANDWLKYEFYEKKGKK